MNGIYWTDLQIFLAGGEGSKEHCSIFFSNISVRRSIYNNQYNLLLASVIFLIHSRLLFKSLEQNTLLNVFQDISEYPLCGTFFKLVYSEQKLIWIFSLRRSWLSATSFLCLIPFLTQINICGWLAYSPFPLLRFPLFCESRHIQADLSRCWLRGLHICWVFISINVVLC